MKESDIAYETPCGKAWVLRDRKRSAYVVYTTGITHSTSDSAYTLDADGLSIAIARANYLDRNK
jgi:hypothetical protein